jgi:hypothetical protein
MYISYKGDFNTKNIVRDNEANYMQKNESNV